MTTEVLADKEGEEPTLAVHVIVDRSVPVLGWVLMVSALFGCAAMVRGVVVVFSIGFGDFRVLLSSVGFCHFLCSVIRRFRDFSVL